MVPCSYGSSIVILSLNNQPELNQGPNLNPVKINDLESSVSGSSGGCKHVYVCSLCQVYAEEQASVFQHILSSHIELLPHGVSPENFISKLKALNDTHAKPKKAKSLSRKLQEQRFDPFVKKKEVIKPASGPRGLFWCEHCLRSFSKPRQLQQHICFNSAEQDTLSDVSPTDSEDEDLKSEVGVDPVPWSRKKFSCRSKKNLVSKLPVAEVGADNSVCSKDKNQKNSSPVPSWKRDPSYVHIFQDKDEKTAFEAHLRSIDYSSIDTLFRTEEKRHKYNNKKNSRLVSTKVYTCLCCNRVSKSLSYMRLHCLTHTDFKPFSCPKCSYCTNSKGSLYTHMRSHSGNMFSCSHCDFKSPKRAHMLDHEETHSSTPKTCKLCKNLYKTQRSLIAHVKKYHCNLVGERYVKSLSSKGNKSTRCRVCKKNFKSSELFKIHNQVCHENMNNKESKLGSHMQIETISEKLNHSLETETPKAVEDSISGDSCPIVQPKDSLAAIVLDNLLQNEPQNAIHFNDVFNSPSENMLPGSSVLLDFPPKDISCLPAETASVLGECQDAINLSVLDQCLQNTDFADKCVQGFSIPSELPSGKSDSVISPNADGVLEEMTGDKVKPAEIKLFEKCRRAPAYVCCVCSGIYICPTTLKAHLKEHVNSTSNSAMIDPPMDHFEPSKIADASSDLDNVCEILQNSAESCSFDEELEKLYTSSLDMIWYLPEVSVVLQNDPALIDSVLDDISNFPMSDNEPPEDMVDKDESDSVLNCFEEL